MNVYKKFLLVALLIPAQAVMACQAPAPSYTLEAESLLRACNNVCVGPAVRAVAHSVNPLARPHETILGNFKDAGSMVKAGTHTMGLAFSRLAVDSAKAYNGTANFLAANCWAIAAGSASLGLLYFYIWPRLNIDISWANHRYHKPSRDHRDGGR